MELKLFKALWGMTGSLESQLARIAEAGYKGVEAPLPAANEEPIFRELLSMHRLDYIAMVFTDERDHLASFKDQVTRAASFMPVSITSHSLKDSTPLNEQIKYFQEAVKIERQLGIPVGHETHRGRALYNPWDAAFILQEVPELSITADYSHWCCVTESTLEAYETFLEKTFSRVLHIHGRVGYAEGPQVSDPRAPEYKHEVNRHFGWWKRIVQERKRKGHDCITLTPEFGPPGYMHTLPYTNQPVADLWDVCLWTGNAFKNEIDN